MEGQDGRTPSVTLMSFEEPFRVTVTVIVSDGLCTPTCAVRSSAVVVTDVFAEDVIELASAEDQQPVEALPADAADPALHVRVRVRRPDGSADDLDVLQSGRPGI